MDGNKRHETRSAQRRLSRVGGIVLALTITDFGLFSYIFSGYIVASHIVIPDRHVAAPARAYDASMKPSPLVLWTSVRKQAKASIPVIDASSVANTATVSANGLPDAGVQAEYRKVSTSAPATVPQSGPTASLSRASKRSNTT